MLQKQIFKDHLIPTGQLLTLYRNATVRPGHTKAHAIRCEELQDVLNMAAVWAANPTAPEKSRKALVAALSDMADALTSCLAPQKLAGATALMREIVLWPVLPELKRAEFAPKPRNYVREYITSADLLDAKGLRTSIENAIGYRAADRGTWTERQALDGSRLARAPSRWRTLVRNTDWSDTLTRLGFDPKSADLGNRLTEQMGSAQGRAQLEYRLAAVLGEAEATAVTPTEAKGLPPGITLTVGTNRVAVVVAEFNPTKYVSASLLKTIRAGGQLPPALEKALAIQVNKQEVDWRDLPAQISAMVNWQLSQRTAVDKLGSQLATAAEQSRLAALKSRFEAAFSEEDRKLLAKALVPAKPAAKRGPARKKTAA